MTITEFLEARLAEDEGLARDADGSRWFHQDKVVTFEALGPDGDYVDVSAPLRVDTRANGWHIANWSPSRTLREVEARRRLMSEHGPVEVAGLDTRPIETHEVCRRCRTGFNGERSLIHPCPTLRLVASAYSDHPDYDTEWDLDETW